MSEIDELLDENRGRRGSFAEALEKGAKLSRSATKKISKSSVGQATPVVAKDLFIFTLDAVKDFLASVGGALIALNLSFTNSGAKVFGLALLSIALTMIEDVVPQLLKKQSGKLFELLSFTLTWLNLMIGHIAGTYVGTVFDNEQSDTLGSGSTVGWIILFISTPTLIMVFERVFELEPGAVVRKFAPKSTRGIVNPKSNLSF